MIKYPARFEKESEEMYSLGFIDFPGAITQGENMEELRYRAQDVLSLSIQYYLNRDLDIPAPSQTEGDDIIWVEPFPEIRQRMGHKKDCECPICRNARGDRKRTKVKVGIMIDSALNEKVTETARKKGVKRIDVIEEALKKYFGKAS